jgi:hypothetical protein
MPPPRKILPHLQNKKSRFAADAVAEAPSDNGRRRLRMALTAAAMLFSLFVIYPIIEKTMDREAAVGAVQVTDCDRLAAMPSDTQKLAVGVRQAELNVAAARAACHKALTAHPDDGRILYQLSRTYSAGGDAATGFHYLQKSAEAGYAQGQFVLATTLIREGDAQICGGGAYLVRAARQRHFPSKIALAMDWLNGPLKACGLDVTDSEITQMLSATGEMASTLDEKTELAAVEAKWSRH